jgi:hypothetical protein
MRTITAIALAGLLGGCVSAQQLAAQDDAKCQSYGAAPGTPAYANCRVQLDTTRTTARAIIAASPN